MGGISEIQSMISGIFMAIAIAIAAVVFGINLYIGINGYRKYDKIMSFYWFLVGFIFISGIIVTIFSNSDTDSIVLLLLAILLGIVGGVFARKLGKFNPVNNVCFGYYSGYIFMVGIFFNKYFPTSLTGLMYYAERYFRDSQSFLNALPYIMGFAMIFFAFIKNKQFRLISTALTGAFFCSFTFCFVFSILKFITIFYLIIAALFIFLQVRSIKAAGELNPLSLEGFFGEKQTQIPNNTSNTGYRNADSNSTTRFCSKCGKKLEADVAFCPECGNKVE